MGDRSKSVKKVVGAVGKEGGDGEMTGPRANRGEGTTARTQSGVDRFWRGEEKKQREEAGMQRKEHRRTRGRRS